MASNNGMSRFMFDTKNLYEDLIKAHIKIHELNQALQRGLKTFAEFRELFIKIDNCNGINLIKTLINRLILLRSKIFCYNCHLSRKNKLF